LAGRSTRTRWWRGGDGWIRFATVAAVLTVAGIAAVVSYRHMRGVALDHGEDPIAAAIIPISVDGLIVAASMALLADSRAGRRRTWLPYLLLALGSAASLAANVMHAQPDLAARVIAAWPSAALIGSYELLMGQIRATTRRVPTDRARRFPTHHSPQARAERGLADAGLRPSAAGSTAVPGSVWAIPSMAALSSGQRPGLWPTGFVPTGPDQVGQVPGTPDRADNGRDDDPDDAPPLPAADLPRQRTEPADASAPAASPSDVRPSTGGGSGGRAAEDVPAPPVSKKAQLAALLATIPADDPRTTYALARDLAPAIHLHTGTARRYLADLRPQPTAA